MSSFLRYRPSNLILAIRLTDDPRLGESDFQKQDFLHTPKVLDDTSIFEEQRPSDDPCAGGEQETHDGRDDPHFWQLPFDGLPGVWCSIVGYSDCRDVCKDGQEAEISKTAKRAGGSKTVYIRPFHRQPYLHDEVGPNSLVFNQNGEHQIDL